MCTVDDLVTYVLKQLSDDESDFEEATWDRDLILNYIRTAIRAVASDRPDMFSVIKEIDLLPGCVHEIDQHCGQFGGVISVDNNDCVVESEPNNYGRKLAARYSGDKCYQASAYDTPGTYSHGGIDFNPDNPTMFRTTNPVPGRGVKAKVYCSETPNVAELKAGADLPGPVCGVAGPAVEEYIFYLAYSKDAENEASVIRARTHSEMYEKHLGINRRGRDDYYDNDKK